MASLAIVFEFTDIDRRMMIFAFAALIRKNKVEHPKIVVVIVVVDSMNSQVFFLLPPPTDDGRLSS